MKHLSSTWFLLIAILATLAGCSATGPAFKELSGVPRDKATIYVYRPNAFTNSGNAPNLFVNDVDHGPLWNAGYIPLSTSPGKINLVLKGEKMKWGLEPIGTSVQAEAGKTYYFRMGNYIERLDYAGNPVKGPSTSKDVSPVLSRTIQIQQVNTDFGRREIVETKMVGADGR
ncbi:MAG TPA: DUF2846 domain-containing protein [Rhodoferax sp.]|jgi:hypothetical protein|nr:DUF2846 domain-containing protein [Rhodoferax sp.]HNV58913.1 DUF2846 domain-containing protein [Rhodoferax sp.]HPW29642.1 DUF2846 domain-containing protein [Rhodoferax sp.]